MASSLLSYADAAELVRKYIAMVAERGRFAAEVVPLGQSAGRVLVEAVVADRDQPPFPRSTRDGFACRAEDANSHEVLTIRGQVQAGQVAAGGIEDGEVWEIMTGAPVPDGADAVVMAEHVERIGAGVQLAASRGVRAGENIVPRGAEARTGEVVIAGGVRIAAAQIALAAQCGYSELKVCARPRVAVLATGNELVGVEEVPGTSQIRNSNSPMLAALVEAAGGEAVVLPVARDCEDATDEAIAAVLRQAIDLLLISGGISAGRFDLVEDGLKRAGGRMIFSGVAMQPGKPVSFGELVYEDGRWLPFFALPGNPISSAVTFQLFAATLLRAIGGDRSPLPRFATAELDRRWKGTAGLTRFLPGWLELGQEVRPIVTLVPWQGSGDLASFARSNCLVVIPTDAEEIEQGSAVGILLP